MFEKLSVLPVNALTAGSTMQNDGAAKRIVSARNGTGSGTRRRTASNSMQSSVDTWQSIQSVDRRRSNSVPKSVNGEARKNEPSDPQDR